MSEQGRRHRHLLRAGRHRRGAAASPTTRSRPTSPTRWPPGPGCATPTRCARSSPTATARWPTWSPTAPGSTRARPGQWALTREGGHSRRRIIHAGGDATGAEVQRALDHAAATLDIRRNHVALQVLHDGVGRHRGAGAQRRRPRASSTRPSVILATGGLGPPLQRHHQPRGLHRRRYRAGAVGRCRRHRHRVHPVPPDDAVRPRRPAAGGR